MAYGWVLVAVTFATQFLCMGFTFYAFGVVLEPLAQEFGGGRFGVTLLPLAMSLAGGVAAPVLGRRVARGSIRTLVTAGCVITGLGFLAASRATALWQLALIYGGCFSIGANTMGGVCTQTLIVNWFDRNRAMALGISLMGISVSGLAMAHLATWLVEQNGWRGAFVVFGWATLAVAPAAWLLVVSRPEERHGALPDETQGGPEAAPVSTADALRDTRLWLIAVACGLAFLTSSGLVMHAFPFAMDAGFSSRQAPWVLSALAGGAALGKPLFGWVAGRIGERSSFLLSLAMQAAGLVILLATAGFAVVLGAGFLLGLGLGAIMQLGAGLVAQAFGRESFGPVMGLFAPILIPFQAIGAPFAGLVFDQTGSYDAALWSFLAILCGAALLVALLRTDETTRAPVSALTEPG